ncbi:MAG: hypothetical protein KDH97_24520, partial [Calditrichaeota bacterium]|nr:hypothetical protein [Calditrichota bacterium]
RFAGFRGSGRDITDAVVAERDLIAAKAVAERASRTKSEFLAAMSHELRTPVDAILSFSDLIRKEARGPHSDPAYKDQATYIYESGAHLLTLINDLLDIAKIEAGKLELVRKDCDLAATVEATVRLIEGQAEQAGVTLRFEAERRPLVANIDERSIRQVVLNVLGNAVKFTDRGGEVRVSVDAEDEVGRVITIEDNGLGIPEAEL